MFYITELATGSSCAFQSYGELLRSQTGCWGSHGWAPPGRFRHGSPATYFFPQNVDEHDDKLILQCWMPYLIERFTELFVAGALAVLFTASMRDRVRFLYSSPIIFNEQYLCLCRRYALSRDYWLQFCSVMRCPTSILTVMRHHYEAVVLVIWSYKT